MNAVTLSPMRDAGTWERDEAVISFLANQLRQGRLSLVLGAGINAGLKLPDWDTVTTRLLAEAGKHRSAGLSNEQEADSFLYDVCQGDDVEFAKRVGIELYRGMSLDMDSLRRSDLLSALGALTIPSSRGSVSRVITFNFDDLLERYLRYYGCTIDSIATVPAWSNRFDVRILHPHGLLPSDGTSDNIRPIVMAQSHFDRIVGQAKSLWRNAMLQIFQESTCIFVGVSGRDANLSSLLEEVKLSHASIAEGHAYWGIRLAKSDDTTNAIWRGKRVAVWELDNWDQLPTRLFQICQTASS